MIKYLSLLVVVCLSVTYSNAQITFKPVFENLTFSAPSEIQNAGDGSNRLFVVEQKGTIKVFPNKADVSSNEMKTFLDITNKVYFTSGQEIGLLGLAFHPNYSTNGYFYVYYTSRSPVQGINVRIVVERYKATGDVADANSGVILLEEDKNQVNNNHNGGKIAFGPDGYLYLSVGDGGGGGDPKKNAKNKNSFFGKIHRIDVDLNGDNPKSENNNYEIPSDNPFVGKDGLDEIYAFGIRNTWKFSFDFPTGRLWGADVGQTGNTAREEVNLINNGGNYGWDRFQDDVVDDTSTPDTGDMIGAIYSYKHDQGDKSITGGYVYRGSEITSTNPDIYGKYIFGDYLTGRIWVLDYNETTGTSSAELLFRASGKFVSSFGQDENGELYFSNYSTRDKTGLYKIVDGVLQPNGTAINGIGQWSALSEGINGIVRALAKDDLGNIYHGGSFTKAGSIDANNFAVWNTNTKTWRNLGLGTNGTINAIAIDASGKVYIGGAFSKVNNIPANNIAVWNGSTWSALTNGVNGPVSALEFNSKDNKLYVGGIFEQANNVSVRNIASWDGTNWAALSDASSNANGMNNEVRALHVDTQGVLYVGGNFDEAGGKTANRIATWNGSNWDTLGEGTSGFVEAITSTPTHIYLGGNFSDAGNQTVNRIVRWNLGNSTWQKLNNGVSGVVNALSIDESGYLYVGGAFVTASPTNGENNIVNNMARWSETSGWQALGTATSVGVDVQIKAIVTKGDEIAYASGYYNKAGKIITQNTAVWSKEKFSVDEFDNYKISIHPNPASSYFTVLSSKVLKNSTVRLYDLTGKLVKSYSFKGVNKRYSIQELAQGLYFLKLEIGGSTKTFKLLKQ